MVNNLCFSGKHIMGFWSFLLKGLTQPQIGVLHVPPVISGFDNV